MNTFQWTTETLFNRERFEAWLANQPGEREFDYGSNDNCLVCNFIKETTGIKSPRVGHNYARKAVIDDARIGFPQWLFDTTVETMKLGRDVHDPVCGFQLFISIAGARTAYQTLYGIDLTPKPEPVEQNQTVKI